MSIDKDTVRAVRGEAIQLAEHLTIQVATDLREQLLALSDRHEVRLDGSCVERVDTAGLQVLAAFRKSVVGQRGGVRWTQQSPALLEALELSGIDLGFALDTVKEDGF